MRFSVRLALISLYGALSTGCIVAQSASEPQPLQVTHAYNLTKSTQVQDNRSVTRQCNVFTFNVVSGTGNWSVNLEYSDVSTSGPWTVFPLGGTVSYTSPSSTGYGLGYHNWVRLNTTAGSTNVDLSCERDFWLPAISSGGGGTNGITGLTGDVTATGPGNVAATLAPVNSNVGTCGDGTHVCQTTFDAKGRATKAIPITISSGGGPSPFTVLNNQANAYTAGSRQTFQSSASTAGLQFGGVTADPSLPIAGDEWFRTDLGQMSYYDGTTVQRLSTGGGGGGGATVATQLGDMAAPATVTGASVTFGANCSASTPCIFYPNGNRYAFTGTEQIALSTGTAGDTVFFYIGSTGVPTFGYNSANTYACTGTGCVTTPSISAFPAGAYPLSECTVASGAFTACTDERPILANLSISTGLGTTPYRNPSTGTLQINTNRVPTKISATGDTIDGSACGAWRQYTNVSNVAVTINQPGLGTPPAFAQGCDFILSYTGAGTVTVTPTNATINGLTSISIAAGTGFHITSDGINFIGTQLGGTTGGGGGGGGTVTVATQLADFAPGTITTTSIPFGSACTSATPCYVNLGGTQYGFTTPVTLNITGGTATDTVYYYLDGNGNRTMGYKSANTYTCTGCENTPVTGISAFPAGTYPLYQCAVTSGAFSASACTDSRPILAATPLANGLGTSVTQSGAIKSVNVSETVNPITGTSYTMVNSDCGKILTFNNGGAVSVALPAAGLGSQFLAGCVIETHNYGVGTVTITPSSSTIGGASTLSIPTGSGFRIVSDGTNYQLGAGGGSGGGGFNGGTITNPLTISYNLTGAGVSGLILHNASPSGTYIDFLNDMGNDYRLYSTGSGSSAPATFSFQDVSRGFGAIWGTNTLDAMTVYHGFSQGVNPVTFSTTPVFDLFKGNVQTITLTANVTSSTIINGIPGEVLYMHVCQDATGGRTFTAPTAFKAFTTIASAANKCSEETLMTPDGTTYYLMSANVSGQ